MKVFVVVAVLVAVASAGHDHARHMSVINTCIKEEKPSPPDLSLLKKQQLPLTERGKCFVGCLFEKAGILKDGVYQREHALELCKKMFADNPEMLEKALAAHAICDKEVDTGISDKCHIGVKMVACVHKNLPDFSLLPD